jgi:O-Antigen ligase
MNTVLRLTPRWVLLGGLAIAAAAANVLLGAEAAVGQRPLLQTAALWLLPAALIAFGALVETHRAALAWIALSINFAGVPFLSQPLPLPGGTKIYSTDVLVLLAIGAWLASRLSGQRRVGTVQLSVVFTWPLAMFAVAVLAGLVKGHERYGANLIGQPFRLVLYSGIALALTDTTPASAWKAITRIFYAGAVVQFLFALYYLGAGTSESHSSSLSTGGVRVLALSTAIYLTGSLICALVNLELERDPIRQLGHAAITGLALFGVIVAFGRTTYAAVVLIVPLLLITRRYMRRTVLLMLPLFVPFVLIGALLVTSTAPNLLPTLEKRVLGTSSDDLNVRWRKQANEAVLEGLDKELVTGVGFGRTVQFELDGTVYTITDDPHNSFVWLLSGAGLLALGTFVLLGVLYLVDAGGRLRRADAIGQALIVWAVGTWLAFMINAAAGPVLPHPVMLLTIWVLFALPIVVSPQATARDT